MKKFLTRTADLFFLTRPVVIAPVWGFCAFGAYRKTGELFLFTDISCYILILLYSLSVASVYVINQIADYEVDKDNAGFPLLVKGEISKSAAWVTALICGAMSIVVPWVMGYVSVSILSSIAIIAGCVYSCKPFSLSGRPFFDFLTNAFEAGLAFAAGWCIVGGEGSILDPLLYRYVTPYFLLMCAGSIGSTLPDVPGDAKHGKITTAVRFGQRGAGGIALIALFIVIPASILLADRDLLSIACAVAAIPFYVIFMIRPTQNSMEMTYKVGGAATMIAASLALPLIFPAGIFIFAITWIYFKKRHRVTYPSLKPDCAYNDND